MRDLARRLDPGRVLLLSTVFFLLTFIKFLTQNKDIWKRMHSRKKKRGKKDVFDETSEIYDLTFVITQDQLLHTLRLTGRFFPHSTSRVSLLIV